MPLLEYSVDSFTWGSELEVGDVLRCVQIPENLGAWEYAETDIVNMLAPYRYVAADPLGLEPPVGGEINVRPARTVAQQVAKIDTLLQFLSRHAGTPTVCPSVMEFHIHVHVPGLKDDIAALKRLTRFIGLHQHEVIARCVQYKEHPLMKNTKTARTYLKWDMGRPMPNYMVLNILEKATNFQDFIRIQCCGKDGVSRGRPFRYAINTYCLKHIDTIEFRCFRATLDLMQIMDCFKFVKHFMACALDTHNLFDITRFELPPFVYDHEAYLGWERTKWSKERGKKKRCYIDMDK